MANLQVYAVAYVTVNGKLLTEHANCTLSRHSNANPVRTVAKGYAGVSQGAADCTISVTNAVPSADFELEPGDIIEGLQVAEIGVIGPGGKTAVSKGFIMSDTFTHGVGAEATLSFEFHGQYPTWQ